MNSNRFAHGKQEDQQILARYAHAAASIHDTLALDFEKAEEEYKNAPKNKAEAEARAKAQAERDARDLKQKEAQVRGGEVDGR